MLDNSDGPSYSPYYCPKKIPFGKFYNNSAHGCGLFGLWIFPGYNPTYSGGCSSIDFSPATFDSFTSYLSDKGAEFDNANSIQFKNFLTYDHASAGITTTVIMDNSVPNTAHATSFYNPIIGPTVINSIIIGNSDPLAISSIAPNGLIIAFDRGQLIKNVTFINYPDSGSVAIQAPFGIDK